MKGLISFLSSWAVLTGIIWAILPAGALICAFVAWDASIIPPVSVALDWLRLSCAIALAFVGILTIAINDTEEDPQ